MTWKSRLSHELEHCFLYLNYSNDIAASDITVLHSSKMSLSVAAKRANQIWISLNGSTVSYKVGGLCSVCITPRSICLVLNMRLGKNWLFGVESQDYNQAMMELKLEHMNEWLVSVDEDVCTNSCSSACFWSTVNRIWPMYMIPKVQMENIAVIRRQKPKERFDRAGNSNKQF